MDALVLDQVERVEVDHEPIINNAPRLHAVFEPGDVSHQGDLAFVAIRKLPPSAVPRKNRQLAEGTTQGSRHMLTRGDIYDCDAREVVVAILEATGRRVDAQYIGSVFVSPADPSEHDITHPEHGHQGFPAGSIIAVVYQRNLEADQREARMRD